MAAGAAPSTGEYAMRSMSTIFWPVAVATVLVVTALHGRNGDGPTQSPGRVANAQPQSSTRPLAATGEPTPMRKPEAHAPAPLVREPPDPAELQRRLEQNIRTLDNRFSAEPLDAAWAARAEASIARFFDAASTGAPHATVPGAVRSRCQSHSCRISVRYQNESEAQESTQQLAMHLGDTLPYGAVMPRQLPDGWIEVNAWYSARPLQP